MARTSPDPIERTAKRLENLKILASAFVGLLLLGAAGWHWQSGLARAEDVQQARGIAADRAMHVESDVAALQSRTAVVEAGLSRMEKDLDRISQQLFEIQRAVGARLIPPTEVTP